MLEHHPEFVASHIHKILIGKVQQIFAVEADFARGCIDQPRKAAHECRFSRTGQPHDHKNFASLDRNTCILNCKDC